MTKYRKKPVVVEAFKYGVDELPQWVKEAELKDLFKPFSQYGGCKIWCEIETVESTMRGDYGDYIIKEVNGEIYPCKPDIFEMTYEKVNGENPEVITKETSLGVIIESLIEGAKSFLMTCPSCDKSTISSQQAYIHDDIKREWYCRNCGQKLNNHSIIPSSNK